MSNDLILREIQNSLALIPQGVDDDTRAVAGNSNFSKRISIKGGVFRKISGGKEIGAIDERHMNIIFVKMAHDPSRTYYSSGYVEGAKVGPTCWSSDSKVPDAAVKTPQGSSCDNCPRSIKGTGQNGRGTACRLSWRTAIVLPADPAGDVMQLVLPATSVFGKEADGKYPFRAYVQYLANHNISAGRVVTRMAFDTSAAVPTVQFQPVAAVPPEDIETILAQAKSPAAETAVKLTVFQTDEVEADAPAQPEARAAAAPIAEPVLREEGSGPPLGASDIPDAIKKWGRKPK
jgi:hypothetical protein